MILIKLVCDSPKLVVTAAEILFFLVQGQPGIFTHTLMEKVAVWVAGHSQVPQLTWYTRGSGNLAGRREVSSSRTLSTPPRWDDQLIGQVKEGEVC